MHTIDGGHIPGSAAPDGSVVLWPNLAVFDLFWRCSAPVPRKWARLDASGGVAISSRSPRHGVSCTANPKLVGYALFGGQKPHSQPSGGMMASWYQLSNVRSDGASGSGEPPWSTYSSRHAYGETHSGCMISVQMVAAKARAQRYGSRDLALLG